MFVLDPNTTGVTIAPIAEGDVPHSVDEQTQVNAFVAQFKAFAINSGRQSCPKTQSRLS
jgi:hypothetical protein